MRPIDFTKYPFPARTRHHTNPSFYIPLNELSVVPHNYPLLIDKIEWSNYFLNGEPPRKLDIGCGRGLFLLTIADTTTDKNILGIEVRNWCCEWLRNYISNESIANCGILRYCVANGLPFIADASIEEIYYLFPDPWIKNKHKKRRAFNIDFLVESDRMLLSNGSLYLTTDLLEVHNYHIKTLKEYNKFSFHAVESAEEWNLPPTNKECFCLREGIPFYRIIAKKK